MKALFITFRLIFIFLFQSIAAHGQDIFLAIESRDVDWVAEIIELDSNVNKVNMEGYFPLFYAVGFDAVDVAELLIRKGAIVDMAYEDGANSLHLASRKGNLEMVKLLVNNGASVHAKVMPNEYTPLYYAIYSGSLPIVKFLLQNGAGVSPDDYGGPSPLFTALGYERIDIADYFVELGLWVDKQDGKGESMMMWSIRNSRPDFFDYLISHGANPNLKNLVGETALDIAVKMNHKYYIKALNEYLPVYKPKP